MKVKYLIALMTMKEAQKYTKDHPLWAIPTTKQARDMLGVEYPVFWVTERVGDRCGVWMVDKREVVASHWNFRQPVVLVRS